MPSDFDKLLKLSCYKKALLRFFFHEIGHPEYVPIIGEKGFILCNKQWVQKTIPRKWHTEEWTSTGNKRNHLEGDIRVVFNAKGANTVDPGNIFVWANYTDIAVILICNIHHMDPDVWYGSKSNYDNSWKCINMFKMFLYSRVYKHSLELITHQRFFESGKLNLCR